MSRIIKNLDNYINLTESPYLLSIKYMLTPEDKLWATNEFNRRSEDTKGPRGVSLLQEILSPESLKKHWIEQNQNQPSILDKVLHAQQQWVVTYDSERYWREEQQRSEERRRQTEQYWQREITEFHRPQFQAAQQNHRPRFYTTLIKKQEINKAITKYNTNR